MSRVQVYVTRLAAGYKEERGGNACSLGSRGQKEESSESVCSCATKAGKRRRAAFNMHRTRDKTMK